MTNEARTQTCPRCNGKGIVPSPVVFAGTPGGCFKCGGTGILRWETAEEINARREGAKPAHLKLIEKEAEELKAKHEDLLKRSPRWLKADSIKRRSQQLEETLQELRGQWKEVKNQPPVSRGRWIALPAH